MESSPLNAKDIGKLSTQENADSKVTGQLEQFKRISELLELKIESDDDLKKAAELISAVSSVGKALVDKVRERNVPCLVSDTATSSRAHKSVYTMLHSDTEWASEIVIKSGVSFLDVVHEFAHAVPVRELPEPLNIVGVTALNIHQPVTKIAEDLLALSFVDEAISRAAELEILKALEAYGVFYQYSPPEVKTEYLKNGIKGIAARHSEFFPEYDEPYSKQVESVAPLLTQPAGALLNIPWGDVLDEYGVQIKHGNHEPSQITLDVKKTRDQLQSGLSQMDKDQVAEKITEGVTQVTQIINNIAEARRRKTTRDQFIKESIERVTEPPELKLPPKEEPADSRKRNISAEAEQTQLRVNISGKFVDIVKESQDAKKKDVTQDFNALLAMAEHSYGEYSVQRYTELYTVAKKEAQEKDSNGSQLKDIGFSLIRTGYIDEGTKLLTYYVDNHAIKQSFEDIAELTQELIDNDQAEAGARLLGELNERLIDISSSFPQTLRFHYSEQEGSFTELGTHAINKLFQEKGAQAVTAKEFHKFVKNLHTLGHYILRDPNYDYVLYHPPVYKEEHHYEFLVELAKAARGFSKSASALESQNQGDLSNDYMQIAERMYKLATFGAVQRFKLRIEKWEDDFKGTQYNEQEGLADFIRQLERHEGINNEYDYNENVASEVRQVVWTLCTDKKFFTEGLELLYSLDAGLHKTKLFETAMRNMPPQLPEQEFNHFIEEWNKSLIKTCVDLELNHYIEVDTNVKNREALIQQDTGITPTSLDTHLYNQHKVFMAQAYLMRSEVAYKVQGLQILQSLPETNTLFFNPHNYISPSTNLFGEPLGYIAYRMLEFDQQAFKAKTLIESIRLQNSDSLTVIPQEYTVVLVNQAFELITQFTFDTANETFNQLEDKAFTIMRLTEELSKQGQTDRMLEIYSRLGHVLNQIEESSKQKLLEFQGLSLQEQEKEGGWIKKYSLESAVDKSKFWQQDYESRLKAQVIIGLIENSRPQEAQALLMEMTASFNREVTGRRDRFDIKSMITASKMISKHTELTENGVELFNQTIKKLGLLRGNKQVFNNAVSYFADSVRDANLSDEQKDTLLSQLVQTLSPAKNKDWKEMMETIPGLIKFVNILDEQEKYPKTELESLRIFWNIAKEIQFDRQDSWHNTGKMRALQELFEHITKHNPEILFGSNFDSLISLAQNPEYLKNLSALLPNESEIYYIGSIEENGVFNLDKIKAGFYNHESIYLLAKAALEDILSSPQSTKERLDHIMQVYAELIKQDLASFRNNSTSEYNKVSKAELLKLRGIHDLYETIVKNINTLNADLSESDQRIVRAILLANSSEESNGKYALYFDFLGSKDVPTVVQRVAFENFIKSGKVSTYVITHFENKVIGAEDTVQRNFYKWIKEFLVQEKDSLPEDRIISFVLENPQRAEEFFAKYKYSKTHSVVPEKLDEKKVSSQRLNDFFKGTRESFFALRDEFIKTREFFIPDLMNDIDLLLVYENRFSWFMQYDNFIEGIRQIYVNNSFDLVGPHDYKYTYTSEQIEAQIKKYQPTFKLTEEQKEDVQKLFRTNKDEYDSVDYMRVRAIPDTRGTISYNQLTEHITGELKITDEQRNNIITFLNGVSESNQFIIVRTFGRNNLSNIQRRQLDSFLTQMQVEYDQRQEQVFKAEIETPPIFQNMPDVVQFILTRYFTQLPYGERQAILADFDSNETFAPERAMRRFFEVTGMEKVGQFLSTRRDFIPENYRTEFEGFQEDVEPSSFDEVRRTIEREFSKPINEIFSAIETVPLNVGTIGEVYKAITLNGQEVVVKIITPSKRRSIKRTLERLEQVCKDLQKNKERFPGTYAPLTLYEEFRESMEEELDFRREYKNAEEIRKELPTKITIPIYINDLSGESILTQQLAQGVHLREIKDERLKRDVIDRLGKMLIDQLTETGVFHDDLHPGNMRVVPNTQEIELLDFGRTGHASEQERKNLFPLLMAINSKSATQVVDILATIAPENTGFDRVGLELALKTKIQSRDTSPSTLLSQILFECGNHGLPVNPTYLRMLKAVMTFEGTALYLDPSFNLEKFIQKTGVNKFINSFGSSLLSSWKQK